MLDKDKAAFVALLMKLTFAFPKQLTRDHQRVYWKALRDCKFEYLGLAIDNLIAAENEDRRFPTPGQIAVAYRSVSNKLPALRLAEPEWTEEEKRSGWLASRFFGGGLAASLSMEMSMDKKRVVFDFSRTNFERFKTYCIDKTDDEIRDIDMTKFLTDQNMVSVRDNA